MAGALYQTLACDGWILSILENLQRMFSIRSHMCLLRQNSFDLIATVLLIVPSGLRTHSRTASFTARMSHDFRQPVSHAQSYAIRLTLHKPSHHQAPFNRINANHLHQNHQQRRSSFTITNRTMTLLHLLTPLLLLLSASSTAALKLTFLAPPQFPSTAFSTSTTATLLTAHRPPITAQIQRTNGFTFRNVSSLVGPAGSASDTSETSNVGAAGTAGQKGRGLEQYLLQINCPDWTFAPYRVDVVREGAGQGTKGAGGVGHGDGENVRVEVYRTFLGNNWNEKGELKGRFVGGKVVGVAGGEDGEGHGNENGKEDLGGEKELKVELEVLGRREYYTARERCKFLHLPSWICPFYFSVRIPDDVEICIFGMMGLLRVVVMK